MIGKILQDKYKIEKKVGKGGFAEVYKGVHTTLKMPVAVKVLDERMVHTGAKARFLFEAESMARLNHPNIVTVHDFAEYKGRPYLVMEYVNGPNLLDLSKSTALTISQVCTIATQVCQAMSYGHKQGIIHRDLTLRNIMINEGEDNEQNIKVLDFGLAKVLHEEAQTSGHAAVGTPYYIAPEQIKNQKIDGRVDIFAFGVGLHRLVNGRFPFEAEHPHAVTYLILNHFDIEFAEGVPDGMKELILRCLEKDPRSRPRDFDEVISELEAIQKDFTTADRELSSTLSGLDVFTKSGSKRNPYLNRVMIKNPGMFFGRSRELRKIYSRLDAPHPQSISVVGERRIGKSSLLNHVYHPRNRRRNMENHEHAIFAYMDFQSDADYDIPRFIDFLFNMFSYELKDGSDYTSRDNTLDQLKATIEELDGQGKRIIILMDEFEAITRNKNFDESFFSFLRSLANSYRVAYVTSSYDDLQRMCHNKDISDSPFFNIFSNLPLRPFTQDEALELITAPSETEGVPLEPYADRILELAGHFPLFLQVACANVFEYLTDNPDAEPDWKEIKRSYMDEVDQHYRFVWERMDEPARDNLSRIAIGKAINKKYKYVNEDLERRGYLLESKAGPDICSSSFKGFVVKQMEQQRNKKGFFGSFLGKRG
ncbi:MAG: protein kinase [Candidatus Krumholzibacteria bacterium]